MKFRALLLATMLCTLCIGQASALAYTMEKRRKRCFINTQKEIPLSTITTICHPEILPSTVSFVI